MAFLCLNTSLYFFTSGTTKQAHNPAEARLEQPILESGAEAAHGETGGQHVAGSPRHLLSQGAARHVQKPCRDLPTVLTLYVCSHLFKKKVMFRDFLKNILGFKFVTF